MTKKVRLQAPDIKTTGNPPGATVGAEPSAIGQLQNAILQGNSGVVN